MSNDFHYDYFRKMVVKIFVVCEGLYPLSAQRSLLKADKYFLIWQWGHWKLWLHLFNHVGGSCVFPISADCKTLYISICPPTWFVKKRVYGYACQRDLSTSSKLFTGKQPKFSIHNITSLRPLHTTHKTAKIFWKKSVRKSSLI